MKLKEIIQRTKDFIKNNPINPEKDELKEMAQSMMVDLEPKENVVELGYGLSNDNRVRISNIDHEIYAISQHEHYQVKEEHIGKEIEVYDNQAQKTNIELMDSEKRYATILNYNPTRNLVEFLYGPGIYVMKANEFMDYFELTNIDFTKDRSNNEQDENTDSVS